MSSAPRAIEVRVKAAHAKAAVIARVVRAQAAIEAIAVATGRVIVEATVAETGAASMDRLKSILRN
jgi:hypothetical protein